MGTSCRRGNRHAQKDRGYASAHPISLAVTEHCVESSISAPRSHPKYPQRRMSALWGQDGGKKIPRDAYSLCETPDREGTWPGLGSKQIQQACYID